MLRESQVNSKGTHQYIYMYPFFPTLPSHPGHHITVSKCSTCCTGSLLVIQIKCLLVAVFTVSTHLPTLVSGGVLGQPPASTPVSLPTLPHPTPPLLDGEILKSWVQGEFNSGSLVLSPGSGIEKELNEYLSDCFQFRKANKKKS